MSKVTEEDITIGFYIVGIVMGILFLCVCIPVFVFYLLFSDTCLQWNTIHLTCREEVFEMVIEHQDELEQMTQEIEVNWPEGIAVMIKEERKKKEDGLETMYTFMKHYAIDAISVSPIHLENQEMDSVKRVKITLSFPPAGSTTWGFYYSESGEVDVMALDGELIKIGDVYRNSRGGYRYETELITDNWYYYQGYVW